MLPEDIEQINAVPLDLICTPAGFLPSALIRQLPDTVPGHPSLCAKHPAQPNSVNYIGARRHTLSMVI